MKEVELRRNLQENMDVFNYISYPIKKYVETTKNQKFNDLMVDLQNLMTHHQEENFAQVKANYSFLAERIEELNCYIVKGDQNEIRSSEFAELMHSMRVLRLIYRSTIDSLDGLVKIREEKNSLQTLPKKLDKKVRDSLDQPQIDIEQDSTEGKKSECELEDTSLRITNDDVNFFGDVKSKVQDTKSEEEDEAKEEILEDPFPFWFVESLAIYFI